ncbi:MAG: sulfotransferase family protein [Candidatus Levyibacteriota bacterium]
MTDRRTRVRGVFVESNPAFPAELELLTPAVGSRWPGWSCPITGRLRLRAQGDAIKSVRVGTVSTIIDEFPVEHPSGDAVHRFGGLVSTVGFPPRGAIHLNVLLGSGASFDACRIEVDCETPRPASTRFSPILVNALPRSGTTWFVSLLSEHPGMLAYPQYPFEVRHSVYAMSLLRTLTNPYSDPAERRELRLLVDRNLVGGSPYYTGFLQDLVPWYATTYGEEVMAFVRGSVEAFYRHVRTRGGWGKRRARHFVEKFPGRLPALAMRWIFPAVREIYLVRNPFDVMASIFRFNQRRGYPDFGEEVHGRSEALFRHVALANREELAFFEERCRDGSGTIVRYEDLRADTPGTLRAILKWLGVDHSDRVIRSMIDGADRRHFPEHVTNRSPSAAAAAAAAAPAQSSPLAPHEEDWIRECFADLLERFYPQR